MPFDMYSDMIFTRDVLDLRKPGRRLVPTRHAGELRCYTPPGGRWREPVIFSLQQGVTMDPFSKVIGIKPKQVVQQWKSRRTGTQLPGFSAP